MRGTRQPFLCFTPPSRPKRQFHSSTRPQMQPVPSQELRMINAAFPFPSSIISYSEAVETAQTFEPQVNTPALSAFLIIAVVFSLLQLRINKVRDASELRTQALNNLRQVKSAQLDAGEGSLGPSEEEVNVAIEAYKYSLDNELSLRTIIPGVRIVAPNDPKRTEADIAAAKQFLGLDLEADYDAKGIAKSKNKSTSTLNENVDSNIDDEKRKNELLLQSRRRFDGKSGDITSTRLKRQEDEESEGISVGGKAVLLTVALTQIALLVVLSFDPMTADSVFTSIGGSPPTDLPSR